MKMKIYGDGELVATVPLLSKVVQMAEESFKEGVRLEMIKAAKKYKGC